MNEAKQAIYQSLVRAYTKQCLGGCSDRYLREVICAYLLIAHILALRTGIRAEKRSAELGDSLRENITFYFLFFTLFNHRNILFYVWNMGAADIIEIRGWYLHYAGEYQNLIRTGNYD